ncbi:MAG: DUF4124 domain-containing protein [Xanthomonadales bacterium]|jgi:hypothetical protein|nr:DUF4124 domain-containing protein [Xanthomonadales bacterium]
MSLSTRTTGIAAAVMMLVAAAPAGATDIYKTVDENGQIIYTDRPPTPDAQPISLRELSVVEAPSYAPPQRDRDEGEPDTQASMNELRLMYRDFKLVSPAPEQNFWGTGQVATIAWDAGAPLEQGLSVVYFVNGEAVSDPTTASTFNTEPMDRGEHTARVDLIGPNNQVIASAGPVTFYVKQNSRLFNRGG